MDQKFSQYFANSLRTLDDAQVEEMGRRVSEFHKNASPEAKMPYELYFQFLQAMAYNAMRQGDEVVVLLDGIAINRQDGRQSAIPFAVDSPEFAAFCREKLNN
jgi:hypothetical protein